MVGSFGKSCLAFPVVPERGRLRAELGLAGAFHAIGEETGLDADHPAETPLGPGELAEAGLLGFVGGLVNGAEAVEEGLELGGGLRGKAGVAGGEAAGAAVVGDFGSAFGGTGAGGALGVAAIGVDLKLGRHGAPRGAGGWVGPSLQEELARGWGRIGGRAG